MKVLTSSQDPYFVEEPILDKRGQPTGKVRKVKKGIPRGVSDHDARILKSVRRRAYRLDLSLFNFCGIQFGWSAIIGIIPAYVFQSTFSLYFSFNNKKEEEASCKLTYSAQYR